MVKSFYKIQSIVTAINKAFLHIAMAALFIVMVMTAIHAILRRAAIGGIADSLDVTQILLILVVYCALAYQESVKGHVRIDMFVDMLPKVASLSVKALLDALTVGILAIFAYSYFINIIPRFNSGAATSVWRIPEWPFVIVVAIGLVLFTAATLLNTIELFLPPNENADKNAGTLKLVDDDEPETAVE